MPEGLEAEIWRRSCEPLIGRTIVDGWVDDRVAPAGLLDEIVGATVVGIRRAGKLVLIDLGTESDPPDRLRRGIGGPHHENPDANVEKGEIPRPAAAHTVGLHFGMTGRLVIDGGSPIERLEYASGRDDPSWDRLVIHAPSVRALDRSAPALRLNDPRRLGRVTLDADLTHLGVDLFDLTDVSFTAALSGRRRALKPLLLDQGVIAGLGNLLADEVLWWAGISPHRAADTLTATEIGHFVATLRRRLPIMLRRGGSTAGTLSPEVRAACPPCPRDGRPLRRETIGGRTAVWCPQHQR